MGVFTSVAATSAGVVAPGEGGGLTRFGNIHIDYLYYKLY